MEIKKQITNKINTIIQSNKEEINELKKQIKIEKMDTEKFNILYMFQIKQILGSMLVIMIKYNLYIFIMIF